MVAVAWQAGDVRTPSTWDVVVGRVAIHTRQNPVVGPKTPHGAQQRVHNFVLNADALLPLRRFVIGLLVISAAYYWFQVYTRILSFDVDTALHSGDDGSQRSGVLSA